jgi:hypothetical protein
VSVVAALVLISFLINLRGANQASVYGWNRTPVDVDARPSRVWDWRDPQVLRGWKDPGGGRSPDRAR